MKARFRLPILFCLFFLLLLAAFAYGVIVGKNRVFPYQLIASAKQSISPSPFESTTHRERRAQLFNTVDTRTDIVFIGDSHTEFGLWDGPFPGSKVINRGIHEDTTADVLLRLDPILATKPKQAFIMLGVNDIIKGMAIDKIIDNYRLIVQSLKNNNIDVVIQSTVQCHVSLCGREKIQSIHSLNEQLQQLSTNEQVRFLSLGNLSDSQGLATSLTFDGIHLTPVGYQIWHSALNQYVSE